MVGVIDVVRSREEFKERAKEGQDKIGEKMLDDNDLFVMTCQKIARTHTFEEKGYK